MSHTVNHFAPQSKTQCDRILQLLIDARGAWVPLPEILALNIGRYGARVLDLRRSGFVIENKTERINGVCHSWYRLVSSPARPGPSKPEPAKPKGGNPESTDWYERQYGPRPKTHPWAKPFSQKRMADPDCLQLVLPGVES